MKIYPCAKVNLGLNIVERRTDGYHDLETVFYPIPLYDTLEVEAMTGNNASGECKFTMSGIEIEGAPTDNLVMKAYRLLAAEHALPPLSIHLHKAIPSQAGMGGGSSDAAYMIRLLNEKFRLGLSVEEMQAKATGLGADCAFFIESIPAFARGIGDKLSAVEGNLSHLKGLYMAVVKTNVAVSTREAFAGGYCRKSPNAAASTSCNSPSRHGAISSPTTSKRPCSAFIPSLPASRKGSIPKEPSMHR